MKLDSKRILARARTRPDLDALRNDLSSSLALAGTVRNRQDQAARTRFNEWEGQSPDYRKHADDLGAPARPFEGAADTRPLVSDTIVNERVALQIEALMAGEMQAVPVGSEDAEAASRQTRLMRWLRDEAMEGELRGEAELLANYQEGDDPGVGILKVWWKRETALEMRLLTLDDVGRELLAARGLALPEDGAPSAAVIAVIDDLGDMIFNPLRKDDALAALGLAFPTVSRKALAGALRDLQRHRETVLPLPFVKENRPAVSALRYMQDIVFPADIDDIQRARSLHEYDRVTEAELRERALSEGLDAAFVDAVIEAGPGASESWTIGRQGEQNWPGGEREMDALYELVYSHTKAADDYGVTGVYLTVWSARVKDSYGKHELLDYPDGEYPYVLFRSERIGRGVYMARGVPSIAGAAQHEIKVQHDCRTDYTQISTVPPVKVRQRRGGLDVVLGPMQEVPVRDQDDVEWMRPPPFPQGSVEVERAVRGELNEYFGRLVPDVPPELRTALLQKKVNTWLGSWKTAWRKITQLMAAFMDPLDLAMVAGQPVAPMTRDEIRGRFNFLLKFSVNDLNLEFVMKRLDAITKLVSLDISGEIDRAAVLRFGFRGIDPMLAEIGLRNAGSAAVAEQKDEMQALALMAQGIEPPLQENGINAGLRLQTLMESVQRSPVLARRLMAPSTPDDEYFAKLVENRRKNLGFQLEQGTVNAAAGRAGTKPVALPEAAG